MLKQMMPEFPDIEQLLRAKSQFIVRQQANHLRFARVDSEYDFQKVMDMRKNVYGKNVPYMLNQINEIGSDQFDERSYIYAVYSGDNIIASARLTPYPFETAHYVPENILSSFLGNDWKNNYLEWTRLLVDTSFKISGVANALTIYAGLDILLTTQYTHYFGYTRPHVRRIFSKFRFGNESLSFTIPDRGDHQYLLLKGCFQRDFEHLFSEKGT